MTVTDNQTKERIRVRLKRTVSTNDEMKAAALRGAGHGSVITAETQTGGRGRLSRVFESPPDGGLYLSYLVRWPETVGNLTALTPLTALDVRASLQEIAGLSADIKWVNDLWVNGRKVAGILTERVAEENGICLIIGIGINVNTELSQYSETLRPLVTSVREEVGHRVDPEQLEADLIRRLDARTEGRLRQESGEWQSYRDACLTIGRDVTVDAGNGTMRGRCLALETDFSLRVRMETGEIRRVIGGEVSVRPVRQPGGD